MKKNYIKLNQNNLSMYLVSFTIEELIEIYTIDIYDAETEEGYQRPPIPPHYRNISKYLQLENPYLPSAIITAVDQENLVELDREIELKGKLRIVDGQHRIEGFRYLCKIDPSRFEELKEFQLPVIIMLIGKKQKIHEINTFIDINSKGKKVSTDLAIRLRDKIRNETKDFYGVEQQVVESIATRITISFNSLDELNIWNRSIKTSPDDINTIISINAFNQSLYPLIKQVLKLREVKCENDIKEIASDLRDLLIECWDSVLTKWDSCFIDNSHFNKQFNLQKGIGVHAIHLLIYECLTVREGNLQDAKELFKTIIKNSSVTSQDWITGGKLSGYNSLSGFRKVSNYIKTGSLELNKEVE